MSKSQDVTIQSQVVDLEKTVREIVKRSNLKAERQPEAVQRAMSNYLEPEETQKKPWETWL